MGHGSDSQPASDGGNSAQLRLMATSDLHMHILPFDYINDRPTSLTGLARIQTLIERLRDETPNSLLVDCGDFLQGTPMADYFGMENALDEGETHPMIAAMNALGYDAGAIGNHEFNYGLDFFQRAVAKAGFPVMAANLMTVGTNGRGAIAPGITPSALLERDITTLAGARHRIRIGVIGLTPPQVMKWERAHLDGRIAARDMVEAAAEHAQQLRSAGADLVIALAHTGIGPPAPIPGMENAALPLARTVGLDALVLGHSHLVFPSPAFADVPGADIDAGTLHGRPAVMPGRNGSHLGVIDLTLSYGPTGWRPTGARVRAIPITEQTAPTPPAGAPPSRLRQVTRRAHDATRAHLLRPVGRSAVTLHSFFAQIADSAALRFVAEAQRAWAIQRLVGTPLEGLPVLSVASPFRAGGRGGPGNYTHVPAGQILMRHVHDLYSFPNTLHILRITGAEMRNWLERVASLYARVQPGARDVPLILPDAAGYNFDVIDGATYELDLSAPPRFTAAGEPLDADAVRVRNLRIAGRKVQPHEHLVVVTNGFRAGGGGAFPGATPENVAIATFDTARHAVLQHIDTVGCIRDMGRGDWRLRLPEGARVLFFTCPDALPHLDEIAAFAPEPLGLDAEGFLRLRLHARKF